MAFPQTPLETKVELQLGGTWTDITPYVFTRDGVALRRGRADEASSFSPAECRLALNNRDGRFSPRNPTGPYYGLLTRNTPLRVSALIGGRRLRGGNFSTPDSAGLSITGDIDIRYDAHLPSWSPNAVAVGKYGSAGQRSYRMYMDSTGLIALQWSVDGTAETLVRSTLPVPRMTGRQAVRATLDVDNGAGGNTATFYTAPTIAGPWTQLGTAVVTPGVTSIFDSTTAVSVVCGLTTSAVYGAEIRQGIGGTVRANPDFTAPAEGATSFADGVGNTWSAVTVGVVTARRYRYHGEIASWPVTWDLSQTDVRTPLTAAGVLRRLGQGTAPLKGPIQRAILKDSTPTYGYWPMTDEEGSTQIASGLPSGTPMSFVGTPRLAASDSFQASDPLPEVGLATFTGATSFTPTGFLHVRCSLALPPTGELNAVILRVFTTGTAARWDFTYTSGLTLSAYDTAGTLLFTQAVGFTVAGLRVTTGFELTQNGANIDWKMFTDEVTGAFSTVFTGTLTSNTFGASTLVQVNPNQILDTAVLGHVTVSAGLPLPAAWVGPTRGWFAEAAGRRIERLCAEEGITFTAFGSLDDTEPMGPQGPAQLLDLFTEAEAADMGQLFESRDHLGLAYRTRTSQYGQATALALSYLNLSDLQPVEDDQQTRNDITVTRIGGSSARATLDSGPLSTQAPPNGVGRYDDQATLSLATDSQLANQAQWRVTIGTIDEPRYPSIRVALETAGFVASAALTDAALAVDHGDLITVTGTPAWLPPNDIKQHTIGQSEFLAPFEYAIEYVCTPATPASQTALWDLAGRYSPDGATLSAGITSTATGAAALAIVTPTGSPLWTTDPADFPLDIMLGGERITLSAISGTSSPQSATVSARSVNGVVKSHSAGTAIDIVDVAYYAL